jgi:predicted Zn-dependent protease
MAQAQPLRLKMVEVKAGDTVDKLAKRMAVADRHVDRFRVLNGLSEKDRVRPGNYVKVVVE